MLMAEKLAGRAKDKLVVIIIGNYNGMSFAYKGKPILVQCIESIRKITYSNYRIVLSELSTDNSEEYVRKHYPGIAIVRSDTESFCAESNNDAIKYSIKHFNPDYLVRLDNDIIITERDWLTEMVSEAERDPLIGVEGCKLVYPDGKIQHAGIDYGIIPKTIGRGELDTGQYDNVREVCAIIGAMFFMRRSAIEKVGLMDENLLGVEDIDYCYEMRKYGYKVVCDGRTKATHLEGFTTSNSNIPSRMDKRFYARLEGYSYLTIKQYSVPKKMLAIPIWYLRGAFMIQQKDRKRSILNARIRPDALKKLSLTNKALGHAMMLYRLRNKKISEKKMRELRRIKF